MSDIRIEVTIYEGYRGAERPSSLLIEGKRVAVVRLLQTWVEEEHKTRKQKRFFALQGSDQYNYTLYYDIDLSDWFMRSREKAGADRE
ncbi:MAG TPA: hypothetical protein VL122_04790 [Nitrospirota bacterium]|nr:hypothetical protein [Nitrospirota bacterium]